MFQFLNNMTYVNYGLAIQLPKETFKKHTEYCEVLRSNYAPSFWKIETTIAYYKIREEERRGDIILKIILVDYKQKYFCRIIREPAWST